MFCVFVFVFPVCVLLYLHLCVRKRVCMGVHVRVLFSCVHSTGQKTECTATGPSRWSSSLQTWRRTSSAEYFGSTTQLGYGNTGGPRLKSINFVGIGGPAVSLPLC